MTTTNNTPAEGTDESAAEQGTDWKAEARKWEQRAKENKRASEELEQIKESQKSQEQQLADRVAKAEKEAARLRAEKHKRAFFDKRGIPAELHEIIAGTDEASWEKAATTLQGLLAPSAPVIAHQETAPPKAGISEEQQAVNELFT